MDRTDRRLLRELQRNGRITNNELAEKVHLSPSPCLRRLRNLEKTGVIAGYTAIVDPEKFGLPINVFVMIRLDKHDEERVAVFERKVQEVDEIMGCYLMAGTHDYLLQIVAADLHDYERFVKHVLHKIPGIAAIESNIAFGTVKRAYVLPNPVLYD